MKPPPFEYFAPRSVDETLVLLDEYGEDAKLLAGGHSLMPLLNFRLAAPVCLVDINNVSELDYVRSDGGTLAIGSMTRHRAVEHCQQATGAWALLREAAAQIGHPHIRNRGTLGGSLAHADPSAEFPAAVTALQASIVVRSSRGTREIGALDFFDSIFTTTMAPDEILMEVRVPKWPAKSGAVYEEVSRRRGDFAQLGAAAAVALDEEGRLRKMGLSLAGASGAPVVAHSIIDSLQGEFPTDQVIEQLAHEFAGALRPPADNHGSSEYRQHLARYLIPRVLTKSITRARAA